VEERLLALRVLDEPEAAVADDAADRPPAGHAPSFTGSGRRRASVRQHPPGRPCCGRLVRATIRPGLLRRPPYGVVVLADGSQGRVTFAEELERGVVRTMAEMRRTLTAGARRPARGS
jgi:hypothetical protein